MKEHQKNRYQLSFFETLTLAAGFTIGSGIITQTGIGIGMTGRSIFFAFLISALLFLVSFRPLFMMSTVLPCKSASYFYAKELLGETAGGFYVYIYFLGRITIAIFGISFAQYLSEMIPAISHPIVSRLTALGILTLFYVVNLYGVKVAARLQNIIFILLVVGLLSFVVCGLPQVDQDFFCGENFFLHGWKGFYSAVSLMFFAVGGAYIITDFAPVIRNSKKVLIPVIYIVTLAVCVIYMFMGMVASGAVNVWEAMNQPLTIAANVIFPSGAWKNFFVIGACLGALATTLNSSFVWYSNSLLNACRDGWLPKGLAEENQNGVPYKLMTIFYLFGAIPTIFGIDLAVLSKMAIGLTIFSACIPMAGIIKLPEKYPKEWEASRYAGKYPGWRLKLMVLFTYLILTTQVYALFTGNPPMANVLIVVYCAGVILYLSLRRRK